MEHSTSPSDTCYTFQPIGVTLSVFRLCVGTPRQGLLAPHARAKINLDTHRIAAESVLDLTLYSHIWVVFVFHLNSNHHSKDTKEQPSQFPAKIAPPALGGKKVGVFSTRTPHRPNPIGMTLCKLDHITHHNTTITLHVSGVDLVDGTPVLDIKPFVPHYDTAQYPNNNNNNNNNLQHPAQVPSWVMDGLDKRRPVQFTSEAMNQLDHIVSQEELFPLLFYGVTSGRDKSKEEYKMSIQACIQQVLAVDVRSPWNTRKVRKGLFHAENTGRVRESLRKEKDNDNLLLFLEKEHELCSQQLDRLLIQYFVEYDESRDKCSTVVEHSSIIDTEGSGADDRVTVYQIEYMSTIL